MIFIREKLYGELQEGNGADNGNFEIGMSDRFLQFKLFISSYIFIVLEAITAAS